MKKKGFTLVELLVVIAIIALLMGILMPALARVRQIAFRMVCGTNLSGIGKAMLIYANDYDDELPRAGGPGATWIPKINYNALGPAQAYAVNSEGRGFATITSSFYLLVKYSEVTTKSFICKGDSGVSEFEPADSNIDVITLWDFGPNASEHCSYSYHQPYGTTSKAGYPLTTSSEPGLAVAADPNPWLDDDAQRVWANFTVGGAKEATKVGNSMTHQDEGQNVLYLDTHVDFENVSYCGINEDNIFTQAKIGDLRKGIQPVNGGLIPISRQDNLLSMDYGSGESGKGRTCFVGETLVSVNDTLVPMSQVEAGQKLANASSVEELQTHNGTFECHDVTLENGNVISVVGSHLFKLDSGLWVHAQDLHSGLNLATQNGTIAIESVSTRTYVGTVYNVKVSQSEEYMVGQDYVVVRDW
jgi:prepilin-type N-terminal cleavage/methylation domain-containing protein